MNLFRSVGMAVWAWRNSLSGAFRASLWTPFLLIAAAQVLLLVLLLGFYKPILLPVISPLMKLIAGDASTQYPLFYFALPFLFSRLGLALSVIVSSLAVGVATIQFANLYRQRDGSRGPWRIAGGKYLALVLVTLILAVLIYGVSLVPRLLPEEIVVGNQMARWGMRGALILIIAVVECLLAYTTAWILLKGKSVIQAIRSSIRTARETFVSTFILVVTPILLLYPLDYVSGRSDWFAGKFRPETMLGIIGLKIFLGLLLGFLLVGGLTRIFLYHVEES